MIYYIIIFIVLYIAVGIITFGIGYKYNFLKIRDDYRRDVKNEDDHSSIVLCIVFWWVIALGILLFSIPKRIIDSIIMSVDEDLKCEESHNNDKDLKL